MEEFEGLGHDARTYRETTFKKDLGRKCKPALETMTWTEVVRTTSELKDPNAEAVGNIN
jgi:hypothetical protein